jgi:ketosteroid isomerase-like protein
MALETMTKPDETTHLRELLQEWAQAAGRGDIDAIMAHYAPDIRSFDAIAQLQFKGADAYRKHWQACMEMCSGPMIFEIHDLSVTNGDDIAFGHYLLRCRQIAEDGKEQAGWMRGTSCWRKRGGRWAIVHEHFSAPFDPASGKTLLDLKP